MNLYVFEPKTYISISGQSLVVTKESEVKKIPVGLVKSLYLHKNVQITSQAICRLFENGINIAWISSDHNVYIIGEGEEDFIGIPNLLFL